MKRPDFAQHAVPALDSRDLLFLFEHFPVPGVDAVEAARRVHEHWNTLDSLLESDYVYDAISDRSVMWLEVSPKLFFNVMLRRMLPGKRQTSERNAIQYLANLLGLFTRTERMYRVQGDEQKTFQYLVDLVAEAAQSGPERGFVVHSHIGNYALMTSGLFAPWIEHRHRYHHRPVNIEYYCNMGSSYYFTASRHHLADEFGLRTVFRELADRFEYYRGGLERLGERYLKQAA
jgi:hypothetical protein